MFEIRLHSHDTLRESGYFVDKYSCILLNDCVYQRPEFVTETLHGSILHFSTIIANFCNFSHAHFLPGYFIFTHKQNINIFKMLSIKCQEIWRFDIWMFCIKINLETVNWIYVTYSQVQ
jgi:hypothetical protein